MKRKVQLFSLLLCAVAVTLSANQASAQSKKKTSGSAMKEKVMDGSGAKKMEAKTAIDGNCPVCIAVGKGLVKGDPSISSVFDGKKYLFPSQEVKAMYDADPVAFTPVLGGDCTVCLKMLDKRVPGEAEFSSVHEKRVYLFPDSAVKAKFDAAPEEFVDVDLASGGNCTVCAVEKNEKVAGLKEFTTIHKGMRYQFPSQEVKAMFTANPSKYEIAEGGMKK